MTRTDFRDLARRAVVAAGYGGLDRVVEKEILHYDILHAMARSGLMADLVFHEGTALRLCHGGERLSEDLDFCTGTGFPAEEAATLATGVQRHLTNRYGLRVRVSEPRERAHQGIRVWRWWIRVETEPERTDMPWQRVKLEIADVQSRSNEARSLARKYDVIPDGNTVLRVETKEGILADKLVAFPVMLPTYVRWRDIWDMHWLRGRGVGVDAGLVRAKAEDYRIEDFENNLAAAASQVPGLVRSGKLAEALGDFVPSGVAARTLRDNAWLEAVAIEVKDMLDSLHRDLTSGRNEPAAGMAASAGDGKHAARLPAETATARCDDHDPFALPDPFKPPRL